LWRGTPGYWEGSYLAGGEGNLRTPCIVRWPGRIPGAQVTDPQEREPLDLPCMHSWTVTHFNRLLGEFQASVKREPPVPPGAPLDFVPSKAQQDTHHTDSAGLISCRNDGKYPAAGSREAGRS